MPQGRRGKEDEIEARRVKVAAMALAKFTEREIGKKLNVDHSTVHRDLEVIRDRWADEIRASRVRYVAQEDASLNRDENRLRRKLEGKSLSVAEIVKIYGALLRIQERRAKLLGLDAPARTETIVETKAESNPLVEAAKTNEEVRKHLDAAAAAIYAPKPEAPKT